VLRQYIKEVGADQSVTPRGAGWGNRTTFGLKMKGLKNKNLTGSLMG